MCQKEEQLFIACRADFDVRFFACCYLFLLRKLSGTVVFSKAAGCRPVTAVGDLDQILFLVLSEIKQISQVLLPLKSSENLQFADLNMCNKLKVDTRR